MQSINDSERSLLNPYPQSMALATLVLSVLGLLGNLLIVVTMVRTQKLQNQCSALIGALAVTDCVICAYLVQLRLIILLNGDSKWTNAKCLAMSVHGIFALSVQSGLGLAIGIDRLLAIRRPNCYNQWPANIYLAALTTPVIAYATLLTFFAFQQSTQTVTVWVCLPPTAYWGRARLVWVGSNVVIVFLVLITYGSAHGAVRRKVSSGIACSSSSRRLLTSLTLVIGVYASTWAFTVLALFIVQMARVGAYWSREVELQLGWLVIINSSCNVLIYAWRGKDYRRAFISVITCSQASPQSSVTTNDNVSMLLRRQRPNSLLLPSTTMTNVAITPL